MQTIDLFEEITNKKENITLNEISIDKLNLTIRSLNALRRANYNTIDELSKLTEEELSNIKNLGKKSVEDIIEKLAVWKEKKAASEEASSEANNDNDEGDK